ncbi:hypothetical protein HPB49_008126 [Dermacentor silvarum]|uniref:Uncharacterized protein n=1 Tax=Dermacentor silvarum TaxID=543639 RepID=A0ACB8D3Y9_DERSI|nr:hypothetical protein HPB49_008126 [Dermacentor silvarum]
MDLAPHAPKTEEANIMDTQQNENAAEDGWTLIPYKKKNLTIPLHTTALHTVVIRPQRDVHLPQHKFHHVSHALRQQACLAPHEALGLSLHIKPRSNIIVIKNPASIAAEKIGALSSLLLCGDHAHCQSIHNRTEQLLQGGYPRSGSRRTFGAPDAELGHLWSHHTSRPDDGWNRDCYYYILRKHRTQESPLSSNSVPMFAPPPQSPVLFGSSSGGSTDCQ